MWVVSPEEVIETEPKEVGDGFETVELERIDVPSESNIFSFTSNPLPNFTSKYMTKREIQPPDVGDIRYSAV
jgi:hypothetical protein